MSKSVEELFRDAPEGTTHWDASDSRVNSFMKLEGDMWFYWPPASLDPSWNEWGKGGNQDVRCMIPRPQPKPWSGPEDGLPPVGIKVDYMGDHCTVVAHVNEQGKKGAILQGYEDWFYGTESTIDPIKTPEQLAAEDRERAIDSMAEEIVGYFEYPKAAEQYLGLATRLHDQGFKREVK